LGVAEVSMIAAADDRQSTARIADDLAAAADLARASGLRVLLEPAPMTAVRDLGACLAAVIAAGADVGLVVDSWHWWRSGGTFDDLRAAASRVRHVQLSDAPADPDARGLMRETYSRRLLPGRGDIPLVELLGALRDAGARHSI